MSPQSKAKAAQGYDPKPPKRICATCEHFTSEIKTESGYGRTWTVESNLRCALGGFAVQKTAYCLEWSEKR